MGVAVKITRTDHSASDLRAIAGSCRDGAQVRRLLAIALIMAGASRLDAARQSGMDRQTLRDWVHRFNAAGAEALVARPPAGNGS